MSKILKSVAITTLLAIAPVSISWVQPVAAQITARFDFCGDGDGGGDYGTKVWAETKDFQINICEYAEGGNFIYKARSKRNGKSISLSAISTSGGKFVAKNGDFSYVLSRKGLVVMQGKRIVLRQAVINYYLS